MSEQRECASILIVDDLHEKRLAFATILERLGQDLVFAKSGREALREVLRQDFAVILLDVNMPELDGFETAALVRRYPRCAHTPIIFITAYADEMRTAQGYSLGAVDCILSPVVPEILCSKVKVFVELFMLQQRTRRQADERVALAAAEAGQRAAEEGARRSNYLARAGRLLSESLDVGVAIHRLLDLLVPELCDVAAILTHDGALVHLAWAGARDDPITHLSMARQEVSDDLLGPCDQAIRDKATLALTEPALDALGALRAHHEALTDTPVRHGLACPLVAGERTQGVMLVGAAAPRGWRVLDELADRAAMAFENARLYASLREEIDERRSAEVLLQKASQRKDEFIVMLSHELRNPLAPIRNAVEVVRRLSPSDPKLKWANDVMDRQVRHLTCLVEELLDVARISQGKVDLHLEQLDLRGVIAHGVETVRPFIDYRRHQLSLRLPDAPVWTRGDFARLSQVVANLLNNAAKYTEVGGQIALSLHTEERHAVITVADNGMGIAAELLPHVFELFEQGQLSMEGSEGGLGVGLTLVQRLVQLHQGQTFVHSAGQGKGATFCIHLSLLRDDMISELDASGRHTDPPPEPSRVLIVDDNVDAAESVAMVLSMYGHQVRTASDGTQALACLKGFEPHAVVLDIGLPGEDGYAVARHIRRHEATRHTLLIALTGFGQREDVVRATEAGFDHHFVKPADPQALAHCIAQAHLKAGMLLEAPAS